MKAPRSSNGRAARASPLLRDTLAVLGYALLGALSPLATRSLVAEARRPPAAYSEAASSRPTPVAPPPAPAEPPPPPQFTEVRPPPLALAEPPPQPTPAPTLPVEPPQPALAPASPVEHPRSAPVPASPAEPAPLALHEPPATPAPLAPREPAKPAPLALREPPAEPSPSALREPLAEPSPSALREPLAERTPSAPREPPVATASQRGLESPELTSLRLAGQGEGAGAGSPPPALHEGALPARAEPSPEPEGWAELYRPGLPVRPHPRVLSYVQHFARDAGGRRVFRGWLQKSGLYRDTIAGVLARRNMPADLLAVVFVESGCRPTAVSHAGAAGLWQLMPETARAYGLSVGPYFDERRGVARATEVAAEHLSDLYDRFLSWDMALAAYNLGYQGLTDRADALGRDDYWALVDLPGRLPDETASYVPKVLAVALLLNNLNRFGFGDVTPASPLDASELEVPPGTPLTILARAAGTSVTGLRELNPELVRGVLPDGGEPLALHVPSEGWARARLMLPRLLAERDGLEHAVSEGFDWGRDELPSGRRP